MSRTNVCHYDINLYDISSVLCGFCLLRKYVVFFIFISINLILYYHFKVVRYVIFLYPYHDDVVHIVIIYLFLFYFTLQIIVVFNFLTIATL